MEKIISKKEIDNAETVKAILHAGKITDVEFIDEDWGYPDGILMEVTTREGLKRYVEFGVDLFDCTTKTREEADDNPFYMKVEGPDHKKISDMTVAERKKILRKFARKSVSLRINAREMQAFESSLGIGMTPLADAYEAYALVFQAAAWCIAKTMKEGD